MAHRPRRRLRPQMSVSVAPTTKARARAWVDAGPPGSHRSMGLYFDRAIERAEGFDRERSAAESKLRHGIRNQLNAISLSVQLLERETASRTGRQALATIRRALLEVTTLLPARPAADPPRDPAGAPAPAPGKRLSGE